jgi:hypothetical protein
VRRVVDDDLTARQRRVFVAIVVDGIPLDALAAELGLQRNAIYKVIVDARRKIRRVLVANGYLDEPGVEQRRATWAGWGGSCGPTRVMSDATRRWASCTSTLTSWPPASSAAMRLAE